MCVRPDATLRDAACLMHTGGFGALPVYEGDGLAGIVTERDLVAAIASGSNPGTATVSTWMSEEALVASPGEDTVEVAERMLTAGVRHLPVVEAAGSSA
jgi:CBS domain-containing protein